MMYRFKAAEPLMYSMIYSGLGFFPIERSKNSRSVSKFFFIVSFIGDSKSFTGSALKEELFPKRWMVRLRSDLPCITMHAFSHRSANRDKVSWQRSVTNRDHGILFCLSISARTSATWHAVVLHYGQLDITFNALILFLIVTHWHLCLLSGGKENSPSPPPIL